MSLRVIEQEITIGFWFFSMSRSLFPSSSLYHTRRSNKRTNILRSIVYNDISEKKTSSLENNFHLANDLFITDNDDHHHLTIQCRMGKERERVYIRQTISHSSSYSFFSDNHACMRERKKRMKGEIKKIAVSRYRHNRK